MTNEEPKEPKEPKENEPEQEEEKKPKRTRRPIPKFEAAMLTDPEKGMAAFYRKMQKLKDSELTGDKERLAWLMRMYQQWLYRLFPADFRDMCWTIGDRKGVKATVRDFIYEARGQERAGSFSRSDIDKEPYRDPASDDNEN